MEIYILFNIVTAIVIVSGLPTPNALFVGLGIAAAVAIGLFILQGFGLYKMAKNRNMKKRWLVFVPFADLYYVGKLTGACDVFGQKVKHVGLFTMIAQIVTTLLSLATIAANIYLYVKCGTPQVDQYNVLQWNGLTGFALTCYKFYNLSSYILSIVQLVHEIAIFVLFLALYKQYTPKNYFGLGMLTLFVPLSRFVIVFVLKNRKAIDYDAYMRARREAYMRARQQYGNFGPYGYGGYGNPYTPNAQGSGAAQAPEEPFAEFGGVKAEESKTQNGGSPFEESANNESPFEDFN